MADFEAISALNRLSIAYFGFNPEVFQYQKHEEVNWGY
jgi:hypothetical protein